MNGLSLPSPLEALPIALACLLVMQASCVEEGTERYARFPQPKGTDPNEGEECPAGAPHLLIGVNNTDYTRGQSLVRRDIHLNPCRGVTIPRDHGDITSVGGTTGGLDLVGFDNGHVLLIQGDGMLWAIENPDRWPAGAVFTIQYQGAETVVVLWMTHGGGWGEFLNLYSLEDRSLLRSFDVNSSMQDAARAVDGSSDRIAAAYDNKGIQHFRIDPSGDTLADGDERRIPRPTQMAGAFRDLTVNPGLSLITGNYGVMYWPDGSSPAFLGPVACVWPARAGEALPEQGTGNNYRSATIDRRVADSFLVVFDGRLAGAERDDTYLFHMSHRGECALVTQASEDDEIVAVAWSGI